jgi:hypothetical protein
VGENQLQAQLGIIWKSNVIEEIIKAAKKPEGLFM